MKHFSGFGNVLGAAMMVLTGLTALYPASANTGEMVEIRGEVIDTWCYLSGVMGGPDAVVGSAHHTCAVWCAAGGIPVGVLTEDGTIYMVLKLEDSDPLVQSDAIMKIQSDTITAKGMHYLRDGVNYIVVEEVVSNEGITNLNHLDYGAVPPFSAPKSE